MSAERTILLWGLPADPPLAAVWKALDSFPCRKVFVDQRATLETEVDLAVGTSIEGTLRINSDTVDLATVHAVYLRPCEIRELPEIARAGESSDLWRRAAELHDILISWAEITPAFVLNRPSYMAANGSKPFQCAWIESLGLRVPETLITTDTAAALEFWNRHGEVIYKSVSGVRSIVTRLKPEHLNRLDGIVNCPTQFQRRIPGTDYRVHIVGEELFASKVTADADDYRYPSGPVEVTACELPGEIADLCKKVSLAMNLPLAGIDLRQTPEGDWYCFEVNPSPGFTAFESWTGQPIARAVAQLLASCPAARR